MLFKIRNRRPGVGWPHFIMDAVELTLIFLVIVAAMTSMPGCTTPVREEIFESGGPTTEEIWYGSGARSPLLDDVVGRNPGGSSGAAAWSRSADSELSALFPELRNPRIVLYVFPHLSAKGHPVPGYVTNFYLFEDSRNFALPGEAFRQGVLR